jgi:3-oxo-5-alpha-steroid 4-dehydrogenase 1
MTEESFHHGLTVSVLAIASVTFLLLYFISAPYGRHGRDGWGPMIPARVGWIVMESPSVFLFSWFYFHGAHWNAAIPLVLCCIWLTHYVHRTFIYPFRASSSGKRIPITIVGMSILFNSCNSYINARWISEFGIYPSEVTAYWPLFVGAILFIIGMCINIHSDTILLRLKKSSSGDYQIPKGGMFRFVSCPNYLGELIEWLGWAVASTSLAGLSFFVFTFANLVPRAHTHHKWYKETFSDYPAGRKAIFPWLY